MISKMLITAAFRFCILSVSIILIACASTPRTVAQDDRIPLREGGPHTGTWESSSISLDYLYTKQAGEIQLRVSPRAKKQFTNLTVLALLVDSKGNVLDKHEIYSVGTRPESPRLQNKFEIPPGTTHLSFSSHLVSPALTPRSMYHPSISR